VLHTQLLPDDTAAILALYGGSNDRVPLDVSVTNTWYQSDADQFASACSAQSAAVNKATDALSAASGISLARMVPTNSSGGGSQTTNQSGNGDLVQALTDASLALQACKDGLNAMQIKHCLVSSRADDWVNLVKHSRGAVVTALCGVNADPSTFPAVSNKVCPGKQVQLRYTLNNHTKLREVLVKAEVWFSSDMTLNTTDGNDVQSADVRESTLPAANSKPVGNVFRLPAKVPADAKGQTYVFVRAVPYDSQSNASLLDTESDQMNNAVMTPDVVKVDTSGCS
jgi:hypothetical protein